MPSHAIRTLRQRGRLKPRLTIAVSVGRPGPPGPPMRDMMAEEPPMPPEGMAISEGAARGTPESFPEVTTAPEDQVREGLRQLADAHPWARSMLARFNALIEKATSPQEAEGAEAGESPAAAPTT